MWKTSVTCTTICSQIDRGIPFSVYPSSAPHPGRYTQVGLPGVEHKFYDVYVAQGDATGKTDEEPERGERRQISGSVAR